MGTFKEQDPQDHPEPNQGPQVEENFISGPPASRTVIDNLKKLLVQRQHSRESDYENKQKSTSGSNSNSDAAFYSQFSTSSSDTDSDSDACLIFEDISNQENRKSNGGRRRHRRQRSYSSSSSSSRSPAEKRRRKPGKCRKLTTSDATLPELPQSTTTVSKEVDSANSTSSHKDSSSSDEENAVIPVSAEEGANTNRLPKFRSRRDRDLKRRRSETNYANDRPATTSIPTIVISHIEEPANSGKEVATIDSSAATK